MGRSATTAFCGRTELANPAASPKANAVSTPARSRSRTAAQVASAHAIAPTAWDVKALRSP
jgi:hypothetical protein